jgi:hypothetical protein
MAIYRRERNFQNLMKEISVETIPLKFVRRITCVLFDGSAVQFNNTDLDQGGSEDLETMLKELEFFDSISDLNVEIDFGRVEADVSEHVANILKRINDQSV